MSDKVARAAWAITGILLVAVILFAIEAVTDGDSARIATRWWLLAGVLVLFIPSLVAWLLAPGSRQLIVGEDGAVSTSKTITSIWTYLIASVLLGFVLAKFFGNAQAFNKIRHQGVEGQYALLFGGPLGAAILAKGIVVSQIRDRKIVKPPVQDAKVSQLVTDNDGDADPGDLQYVLFNFVAMVYFAGTVVHVPLAGFPHIPNVLMGLTSVAAVGYVGKKTIPSFGGEPHSQHVRDRQRREAAERAERRGD